MKNITVQLIMTFIVSLMLISTLHAEIPYTFNYQGRLVDGTNLVNDTKTFYVRIYDAASGGTLLYAQTNSNIVVNDGLYSMEIGNQTNHSLLSVLFNHANNYTTNTPLYLELQVNSQTLSPREEIRSAPYAQVAGQLCYGAVTSNHLAANAVTEQAIAPKAVKQNNLADNCVASNNIAGNSIYSHQISDGTIISNDINWAQMPSGLRDGDDVGITSESDPLWTNALANGFSMEGNLNVNSNIAATGSVTAATFVGDGSGLTNLTIAFPEHWLENTIWVATNGTFTGPGTINHPFDSPQAGYNAAIARYPHTPSTVVICSGNYAGGLVMTSNTIHILGISRPQIPNVSVNNSADTAILKGKMRVQGLVLKDGYLSSVVSPDCGGVKFVNCRFQQGIWVRGRDVEFFHCKFRSPSEGPDSPALFIGYWDAIVDKVAVINSTIEYWNTSGSVAGALLVTNTVYNLEVSGCEIVSKCPTIPAIADMHAGPIIEPPYNSTLHLYTRNYIKQAHSESAFQAVITAADRTIAFHQNTVFGDLGNAATHHRQYHSNNMIYGRLYWYQGGGSWNYDNYNNTIYYSSGEQYPAKLPDPWND